MITLHAINHLCKKWRANGMYVCIIPYNGFHILQTGFQGSWGLISQTGIHADLRRHRKDRFGWWILTWKIRLWLLHFLTLFSFPSRGWLLFQSFLTFLDYLPPLRPLYRAELTSPCPPHLLSLLRRLHLWALILFNEYI